MKKLIGLVTLFTLAMPLQSMAAAVSVDAKLNSTPRVAGVVQVYLFSQVILFRSRLIHLIYGVQGLFRAGLMQMALMARTCLLPDRQILMVTIQVFLQARSLDQIFLETGRKVA